MEKQAKDKTEKHSERLKEIPELAQLGDLFKTSPPIGLTESEAEILVKCRKHTFNQHLVLQFECTNTLADQYLENLDVSIEVSEGYDLVQVITCRSLRFESSESIFAILSLPGDVSNYTGYATPTLHFDIKECDPVTG